MKKKFGDWKGTVGAWGDPPCYPAPLMVEELARAQRDRARLVVVVNEENQHNVVVAKDWGIRAAPIDEKTATELIEREIADGPIQTVAKLPCPPPPPPDGDVARLLGQAREIEGLRWVADRLSSELVALQSLVAASQSRGK